MIGPDINPHGPGAGFREQNIVNQPGTVGLFDGIPLQRMVAARRWFKGQTYILCWERDRSSRATRIFTSASPGRPGLILQGRSAYRTTPARPRPMQAHIGKGCAKSVERQDDQIGHAVLEGCTPIEHARIERLELSIDTQLATSFKASLASK